VDSILKQFVIAQAGADAGPGPAGVGLVGPDKGDRVAILILFLASSSLVHYQDKLVNFDLMSTNPRVSG
jgi:hypothetical protein